MKLKNLIVFLLMPFLFLFNFSCSNTSGYKGVKFELKITPPALTDFLYAKMNYQFKIGDEFTGLDDQYKIFVHLWRLKTKEMLLQDDHSPEKPFSQWKAGDTISYARVIFIPEFLDEFDIDFEGYEEIRLTVGLYKPTAGDKEKKFILYQKVLNVESASLNAPELVYDEGWNQPEHDPKIKNPDERSWRWTKKKAVCIVQNPHKESLLIIRGGADKAKFADQKVIFKINDQVLEEFIPKDAKFKREYVIAPEMMGTEDEFRLTFETDKTFIPAQLDPSVNDNRELGIQIFFLYFRENTK
jgi:hypothetical protein